MSRIRANQITNKTADGATTATNGFNVTGVCTATSFSGNGSALTGITQVGGATGVDFNDDIKARFGDSNELTLFFENAGNRGKIGTTNSTALDILTANTQRVVIENSGHVRPAINNSYDLGTSGDKWRNLYATTVYGDGSNLTGITLSSDAQSNTLVGTNAGANFSGTSASSNTLVGRNAGGSITTGDENTAIGSYALSQNQTGGENIAIGKGAFEKFTDSFGVAIGLNAATNVTGGMPGIIMGRNACYTATTLGASVVIGMQAASAAANVTNCVIIGDYAKSSGNLGSNNIIIGQQADCSSASAANEITLGNSNITRFRVPGLTFDIQPTAATLNGLNLTGLLREAVAITAGKLSDNTNIDLGDGNVHYFSTQETTTSTPNLRFNSSTTLNSVMDVNESISVTIITTAAAAAYSAALNIDGSTSVVVNWVGGSAPSAGGSSGLDIYTYTIIKTSNATYKVIGNLTKTS